LPDKIINGIKLHYELTGRGNPILLVHGFLGNWRSWNHQIGLFANRYTVITPDMRGHGKTDRLLHTENYLMEVLASDLFQLLKALDINKCCIIGHSWGARITAQFAIRHRDMLNGIVLISNSGECPREGLPEDSWKRMDRLMKEHGSVKALLNVVETDPVTATFYNYKQEIRGKMLSKLNGKNAKAYAHAWEAFTSAPKITSELQKLDLPVLLIVGENDLPNTLEITKDAHQLIPDSQLLMVKGVAHFPQDDAPDIVNRKIMEFLNGLVW
jgi:pimeloyl-ACP methyl ester carboxylesterase